MSANDPRRPGDPDRKAPDAKSAASLPIVDLGVEGTVDIGDLPVSEDASSIALSQLPEPPSGQSLTSWTEVIRRQRSQGTANGPGESVQVDAPSDKDLLDHIFRSDGSGPISDNITKASDTSEIPQGEIPVYAPPASPLSESDIDIGKALPFGSATSSSHVVFDIIAPPSDAAGVMPLAALPLSAYDLGSVADLDLSTAASSSGTGISGIDLGAADIPEGGPGRSSILDELLRESGGGSPPVAEPVSDLLDYGDPPPPPVRTTRPTMPTISTPSRSPGAPTHPGIDLGDGVNVADSDLNLDGPASSVGVDEEVDLRAEVSHSPNLTDSGTLEISPEAMEESQRRAEEMDSSSIDLNSRPSLSGSEFDVGLASEASNATGSNAHVDLNLPTTDDETNSSMVRPRERLSANDVALAAEFGARRRQRDEADEQPQARKSRGEIIPARDDRAASGGRSHLIRGAVLGLILGAGSVLAAYFGGALPNRGAVASPSAPAPPDNSAALAKAKADADAAKKDAADAKAIANAIRDSLTQAGIDPEKPAEGIKSITDAKAASDAAAKTQADLAKKTQEMLTAAQKAETDAKTAEDAAKKSLADAEKATMEAKKQLIDATKAVDIAKAETVAAKKAADESMAAIAKSLQGAGIDPAKADEGLKKILDAKTAAEAKEKELATKVADASKKETDLTTKLADASKKETDLAKQVETARKTAEDAAKARQASEATLTAITDKLAKAKFVGEKPDATAIAKGLDDALKAATTDATASLRDDLVKARAAEAKMRSDLATAREKEIETAKLAAATKAEAIKAQEAAKAIETKLAADSAKYKADAEKLAKDATSASAKAVAAEKLAAQQRDAAAKFAADSAKYKADAERLGKDATEASAKAVAAEKLATQQRDAAEKLAAESTRLKADNERLARDLEAVRELAELIKTPSAVATTAKPDPIKLADRFFVDGLRAFYAGQPKEAETAFRKAIQFRGDDARYHYLLGLALWTNKDEKGAELAFEKGRDLESEARPSSRVVSAALERIQGPARQAVNAYRP